MYVEADSPILSSISTAKQPPAKTAKKPNLSWKRRKDELHRLRAEAQALETRVMFLKLQKTQDTLWKAGVGLSEEQKLLREAAANEKQQCQSAREENTQLKGRLERCYKACHDLQTVLSVAGIKQHNLIVANTFAAKALQAEQRSQRLLQLSSDVLTSLANRVNDRLTELDYIIENIRASMFGPDVDQVNVHREGDEGTSASVEFKRNRMMPFDADNTSRVIWDVMHLGVIPDEHCARVIKQSHDTLLSQGCETQALAGGGTVDLVVSCLMKRVLVPGGFIMLIESTTEWQARPAQAKAWTHVTRDSGWALVHPNDERPGTCQVQLAVRLRTEDTEQNGLTLLTPVVCDVVIPSFGEVLSSRHQLVENALLDSTRTTSTW
ncbi:hypothetical protein L917_12733 [Phytophthora nicotianae]|uniref:Uncharacterized protein n=3 Tax=Phytophthora nicotianae TaxID=4792 RepID=V9ETS5_PHYNI|nr:hypothetical protein F443_13299 [Phytophthora nicotianae P1569]ETL88187.1 hypothetical protein L917_12733 [Phytophthora nicotianae]ETO70133.1 hypothetical protein F444_13374 [Phytophthora nicotianae P1976]